MVTVTLTEPMVNAINAGLQDRQAALTMRLARHRSMPESASRDFTIETIEMALRDATTAYLAIAAALDEPEYPAEMTVDQLGWTDYAPTDVDMAYRRSMLAESELRLMDGNR